VLRTVGLATLMVVALFASPALADDRYLPFTYQYATPSQGERELEFFTSYDAQNGFENQLEFEYGLTDRIAVAAYIVAAPYPLAARALQFEGRYRLFEKGVLPVDVTFYGEYEHFFSALPNLETKLLLEKDLGRFTLEANIIGEKQLGPDPGELRGTMGGAFHLTDEIHPGIELVLDHDVLYVGPTTALIYGPTKAVAGAYYSTSGPLARLILQQEF
jgi:hypothetical protein